MDTKIYYGGNIITMNDRQKSVEAVMTCGDTIINTGSADELFNDAPFGTEYINLDGNSMLPAFIDSHSHFSGCAFSLIQVSLDGCKSFGDISEQIQSFIKKNSIPNGEWITARGYDTEQLFEKTHPDRALLDSAAPRNPIVAVHISEHSGVFSTMALEELGVDSNTAAPSGGTIEKKNGIPTGFMEESAFIQYFSRVPMPDMKKLMAAFKEAQHIYASYGITTAQEGMLSEPLFPIYDEILKRDMLMLDIVGYIDINSPQSFLEKFSEHIKKYKKNFKIGGYKIFLDGSPQSRTAWLREPYINCNNWRGYGTLTDRDVLTAVRKASSEKMQLLAHCNGDMALEQYLNAWKQADMPYRDTRPVIIHAQIIGDDQLSEIKRLGLTPSFFINHIYHWGDTHIKNIGEYRAKRISRAGSALKNDIIFTFHQDSPVTKPDMLETIWCAVNRLTKNGTALGAEPSCDERIPVYEALKAVTINASWQYHEENKKGSIDIGKNADFVILDTDPLSSDPMELKNIKVLNTIKNGEIIF